ncbi:MAG: hypothetical protein WCO00_11150 [Rhodospirillaceae bacterium]
MSGPDACAAAAGPSPRAWVVFCDGTELAWLRLLRPGFRHCFVMLHDGERWIAIDPLAALLEVTVPPVAADFDLPGWFAGRGHAVVAAPIRRALGRPAPWAPFTCVETCKRVLGLRDRLVLTPWQLYRRLTGAAAESPPAVRATARAVALCP